MPGMVLLGPNLRYLCAWTVNSLTPLLESDRLRGVTLLTYVVGPPPTPSIRYNPRTILTSNEHLAEIEPNLFTDDSDAP